MQHLKLTFEDIMQANILYYDKISEAACYDICGHLKIDNMPSIDGQHFYELTKDIFLKKKIENMHKISVDSDLFDKDLLNQFKANMHNILFVFEETVMKGVVHISDYNRDIVLQKIQDDVLSFERKLRQLILLNNYKNGDMRKFFEYQKSIKKKKGDIDYWSAKIINYDKREQEINSLGQFQLFEFTDLMKFAASSFSNTIHKIDTYTINHKTKGGIEILRELRNMAMHGKNPVSTENDTQIYSLESLHYLIDSLFVLRQEYTSVSLKIRKNADFLKAIELDNRGKLEIIHNHHPKALEYFLGF